MSIKSKALKVITLTAVSAIALTGCGDGGDKAGGDKAGEKISVGFALKVQDSPYFISLAENVTKFSEANGWELTILDANGDTAKEAENMETFIAQGKDLISVSYTHLTLPTICSV